MLDWFAFDFVRNALLAMVLLAVFYPLMGVYVVGQRVAYFGDAVAHSAFAGAALAAILDWQMGVVLLITAPLFALLIAWFQWRTNLPTDVLLVVVITSVSAAGIALVSLLETPLSLGALLFGDLLAIERSDLWRLLAVDCFGVAMLLWLTRPLIRIGFHRELAQAQGVPVRAVETLFLVGLALVVAVGIRAVGILPMSALLVLPAAAARAMSRSFRGMLFISAIIGWLCLILGFGLALWQPIPPGAAVALVASIVFVLTAGVAPSRKERGW
ncbi:High-affinity zinc uptake system membrane protein ZnuB [bacterium HR15]|nr:High-affinity zinc uptake system membrane protein ZnuB [bacterium HR15]